MAKDVKFLITANVDRAEKEIAKLGQTGAAVSDRLSQSFADLGMKSTKSFDDKRKAAESAYQRIKSSGVATGDELVRAEQAHANSMVRIDEEQFGKRTGLAEKFKANWLGITAAVGGAWLTVSQGWALAEDAAKGMQQRQSMANLAASYGQDAEKIVAGLKAVSGETISTRVLVEKAGTAMLLGIPADKLSSLMEIARASSKMTGQSVTDSFADISLAVGRSSRMILDNLGIIVSEEAAQKTYAATLGKTSEQLTDAEKKTAFLNATLAAGKDIIDRTANSGETMADKMQRVAANMQDFKEKIGTGVLGIMLVMDGAFKGTAAASMMLAAGIFKVISGVSELAGAKATMQEYQINAEAALEASLDLAGKGKQSLGDAMDVMSGKLGPLNSKMGAFQNESKLAAEALEKLSEAKKIASTNIAGYSREVDKLGSLQMKAAATGFTDDLKKQSDYLKLNNSLAANMSEPITRYGAIMDEVYGRQLDLQKQIGQALFKIGADQAVIAQQNIQIANVEKASAESRLGAWTQYYDNLRAMHTSTMAEMKKSQQELMNMRMVTGDLVAQVQQKLMTPMQQYYDQVARLEEKQKLANSMATDEKMKLLQQVQQQWAGLSNEIKDGDTVLLSQTKAAAAAVDKIQAIGVQLEQEKAAQIGKQQEALTSLQAQMTAASNMVTEYQLKLRELDGTIAALTRTFSLTMKDEASPAIRLVHNELDALRDKTITVRVNYEQVYPQTVEQAPLGQYAGGTDYVPKTGLYVLHRGEEVKNTTRVAREQGQQQAQVNFNGGMNFTLPNVTNQSTARDLAREILPEIQDLISRTRRAA